MHVCMHHALALNRELVNNLLEREEFAGDGAAFFVATMIGCKTQLPQKLREAVQFKSLLPYYESQILYKSFMKIRIIV